MRPVYVLSAVRTPIGKFGGAFAAMSAAELGGVAARAAVERSGLPADAVTETIFGHARQAGGGPNTARQVSRRAGVPDAVPAFTVNKACASSLKAITLGALSIGAGENEVVLAGGTECMSATPYLLPRLRFGLRMGDAEVVDGMYRDGFLCPLCGQLMGETAETLAREYGISRAAQDAYAAESQRRAAAAIREKRFADEIVPGPGRRPKGRRRGCRGRAPAAGHDGGDAREAAARLRPDRAPSTRGTRRASPTARPRSCSAPRRRPASAGVEPLARVAAWTSAGVDPARMGIGPVPAVRALLEKTGLAAGDVDLIELNEAFAAQVLACARDLPIDLARVNVNGGAIALGHPIGATGARISTTLLHEMKRRGARRGIATLCVSGGMGMAVLFEMGSGL